MPRRTWAIIVTGGAPNVLPFIAASIAPVEVSKQRHRLPPSVRRMTVDKGRFISYSVAMARLDLLLLRLMCRNLPRPPSALGDGQASSERCPADLETMGASLSEKSGRERSGIDGSERDGISGMAGIMSRADLVRRLLRRGSSLQSFARM